MTEDHLVAHVKADGGFIEWVSRERVHQEKLVHLSINVLVFHPDGRLLIQKRHAQKRTYPHYWDVSCSGHVDYADYPHGDGGSEAAAFAVAAPRELAEELGVRPTLVPLGVYPPEPGVNYERTMVYSTVCEGPFSLQASEVEMVRWTTRAELYKLEPITPLLLWMSRTIVPWPDHGA